MTRRGEDHAPASRSRRRRTAGLPARSDHRRGRFWKTARAAAGRLAAISATALATCLFAPVHACAGELNTQFALASQLVDRGLAITPAKPAVQAAVAWSNDSGWSIGLSAGAEARSPGDIAAIVARGARSWALSANWQMQADLTYYHYASLRHVNAYESGVNWTFRDILELGVSAVHTAGVDRGRLHPAVDVDFHWPLAGDFFLSGGIGIAPYATREEYDWRYHTGHYRYGQVGLLWSHHAWRVELDRVAVDPGARRRLDELVASPWLASIAWSF